MSDTNTHGFVSAIICDLVQYLDQSEPPIVIGKDYSSDRLYVRIADFCRGRNINLIKGDLLVWLHACEAGHFRLSEEHKQEEDN